MSNFEFSAKSFTLGQINALVKMLGGESNVQNILSGELIANLEAARFLTGLTTIDVRAMRCSPREFYRPGKYIFRLGAGEFKEGGLVDLPMGSVSVDHGEISYADVTRTTREIDICNMLPKDYMFRRLGKFLCRLASLIDSQMEGGEGPLLTNGLGNVFYFCNNEGEIYHASVGWNDEQSPAGWVGRVYQPSNFKIGQGTRVFCANNF